MGDLAHFPPWCVRGSLIYSGSVTVEAKVTSGEAGWEGGPSGRKSTEPPWTRHLGKVQEETWK